MRMLQCNEEYVDDGYVLLSQATIQYCFRASNATLSTSSRKSPQRRCMSHIVLVHEMQFHVLRSQSSIRFRHSNGPDLIVMATDSSATADADKLIA
jgi:hypothetical protein